MSQTGDNDDNYTDDDNPHLTKKDACVHNKCCVQNNCIHLCG